MDSNHVGIKGNEMADRKINPSFLEILNIHIKIELRKRQ